MYLTDLTRSKVTWSRSRDDTSSLLILNALNLILRRDSRHAIRTTDVQRGERGRKRGGKGKERGRGEKGGS